MFRYFCLCILATVLFNINLTITMFEIRCDIPTRITFRDDTRPDPGRRINYENLQIIQPIITVPSRRFDENVYRSQTFQNKNNLVEIPITKQTNNAETNISLASINVRSLRKRLQNVKQYCYEQDTDIVAFTETWLSSDDKYEALELCSQKATIHRYDRNGLGGGVAIMCKNELDSKPVASRSYETFENVIVSVSINGKPIRIACIYRPPCSPPSRFIDEFSSFLEDNCLAGDPIVLTGDFNIHLDVPTDSFAIKFNETLYAAFGLKQHISGATHDKGHTLDLIISRSNDDIAIENPHVGDFISDHRAIHCALNLTKPKRISNSKQYRKIGNINIEHFKTDIANSILVNNFLDYDLDKLVKLYDDELTAILDKHAPIIHRSVTNPKREPWYDNSIHSARKDLRTHERKWTKSKKELDKANFLFKKKQFENKLDQAKSDYYTNLVDENKHDQGLLFKTVNRVMHRVKDNPMPTADTPERLANNFNNFFNTKIENIRANFDDGIENAFDYDCKPHGTSSFTGFTPLSDETVKKTDNETKIEIQRTRCHPYNTVKTVY